jgi:hypothetical protein
MLKYELSKSHDEWLKRLVDHIDISRVPEENADCCLLNLLRIVSNDIIGLVNEKTREDK